MTDSSGLPGVAAPDAAEAARTDRPFADARERALAWLRSSVPGRRVIKTALAVALAWWVGTLLGEERPLFAALGALVGMQATVTGSLRRTGLQLAGMLGGLGLAFVVGHLLGAGALGIGLAVLLGLWLGRGVGSPERVGVELGVTTLLIVALGGGDLWFAATRIWETILGGLVAAAVNALILPPDYLDQVVDDLDGLATPTARGLREATRIFVERPEHEGAADLLERLREARQSVPTLESHLSLAGSALRLSPLLRGREALYERCRQAVELFGRVVHHATTLARVVQQHAERPHPWAHGDLASPVHLVECAEELSHALERYEAYVRSGSPARLRDVRRDVERARALLDTFLTVAEQERASEAPAQRLVDIAAVASELEHIATDLANALDSLVPYAQADVTNHKQPNREPRVESQRPNGGTLGSRLSTRD